MRVQDYSDYPAMLEDIRTRPGLWLGRPSLTALEHFLHGIWKAEDIHEMPAAHRLTGFDFPAFEEWVEKRYNPTRLTLRSFGMARRLTSDEEAAFYRWFEWYDEYRDL